MMEAIAFGGRRWFEVYFNMIGSELNSITSLQMLQLGIIIKIKE